MLGKKKEQKNFDMMIDIELVKCNLYNPNIMTDNVFNDLVDNIRQVGMVEPILVVRKGKFYEVVGGEHRLRACKVLGHKKVWCEVLDLDEDMQKFLNMRMNIIKGKIDPVKFTKLFEELSRKYSKEAVKKMMMFTDEAAFQKVYQQTKDALPEEMQKKLEEVKQEIKNIDDLSQVLNRLFAEFGSTLKYGYMFFKYGGQICLMIQMDKELKNAIQEVADEAKAKAIHISQVLIERLRG